MPKSRRKENQGRSPQKEKKISALPCDSQVSQQWDSWDTIWEKAGKMFDPYPERAMCLMVNDCFLQSNPIELRPAMKFLDIGSGGGRNSDWLKAAGCSVFSIDISKHAKADHYCSIDDLEVTGDLSAVIDIKTLCHHANPPFEKIHRWIAPGGIYFAMWPSISHVTEPDAFDIGTNRDAKMFVMYHSEHEIRDMLKMFAEVHIREERIVIGRTKYLYTWVIEALK